MHDQTYSSKPKTAEQPTGEGGDETACSASSDTPETDTFEAAQHPSCRFPAVLKKMRKLERQRNAAWKTLKEIRQLLVDDESFGATVETLFAKPLEEAEAEIARLNSLLNDP